MSKFTFIDESTPDSTPDPRDAARADEAPGRFDVDAGKGEGGLRSDRHDDEPEQPAPAADEPPQEADAEPGDAPKKQAPRKRAAAKKTTKKTPRKAAAKTASKAAAHPPADAPGEDDEADEAEGPSDAPPAEMLVNYVPGEECRIAIVEDGQLEEFYSEPTNAVSRVGNIYVGRVTNVESSIQAAFVDFGLEENGFLHVSDLHPQYFPGEDEDTKERVGKKTPRRSRPPIQQCLRRGQEIIVQVLKEGVGTKGPTLTSYLSIPGRFLVMMPQMDKVGVSRKEEDDDKRRQAKAILDQLELPEEFGFILRTAGLDRTKAELKRDLAYLLRLWKDMEKKRQSGKAPRLLYTESDLLLRSLRDLLTNSVSRVVIDSEAAINRAARFMKIVAPRSGAKLVHYQSHRPIFHAFGVEDQIRQIHAREVSLPSGGRLVIDQTEALVAIDVNSGKSRKAGDAESNAYNTNVEAVDVICRQLRLRDLGGLVICDLIDMRAASRRKDVENRFRERLKRDRARSTILPITQFGILEMTRQRMRGSQESMHFADCPICHGRGLVQRPDSVAADAMRELADLLDHQHIQRVELVVHPRVAGALLSTRRQSLTRVELTTGKHVDVRISDSLPLDRVTFYAYDEAGADIEINRLPTKRPPPPLVDWDQAAVAGDSWAVDLKAEAEAAASVGIAELAASVADHDTKDGLQGIDDDFEDDEDADQPGEGGKKKRRRRRRRGRRAEGDTTDEPRDAQPREDQARQREPAARPAPEPRPAAEADADREPAGEGDAPRKKRRRRRRRGGRGGEGEATGEPRTTGDRAEHHDDAEDQADAPASPDRDEDTNAQGGDSSDPQRKKRRRRGRRGRRGGEGAEGGEAPAPSNNGQPARASQPAPKAATPPPPPPAAEPKPVKRRGLYASGRRKLSPSESKRLGPDD